jgi:cysteine synthase
VRFGPAVHGGAEVIAATLAAVFQALGFLRVVARLHGARVLADAGGALDAVGTLLGQRAVRVDRVGVGQHVRPGAASEEQEREEGGDPAHSPSIDGMLRRSHRMTSILDHIGRTPLVRLRSIGQGLPAPVLVKCEHLNPSGSVKDRIALAIVDDAERRGVLRTGDTLVEATAGNTGMGLALVAAARGYGLVCVMPEKMSVDKRAALAGLGARVVITPNASPESPEHFQNVARRMAKDEGWFLTDQFCNPANVRAHEQTTGPEILEQCAGRVGAFVAGAGTGGTITGVGRFLRERGSKAKIVLADPVGSGLARWVVEGVVGPDATYLVEGIGTSKPPEILDRTVVDAAESVSDAESFAMARRLWREEGLYVGGSAGTAVAAALRVAASGAIVDPVVALLPDSWDRYLSSAWVRSAPRWDGDTPR